MGIKNSNKTMEKLKNRNINIFLHIGDISYADDKGFEFGKNNYYGYKGLYGLYFKNKDAVFNYLDKYDNVKIPRKEETEKKPKSSSLKRGTSDVGISKEESKKIFEKWL